MDNRTDVDNEVADAAYRVAPSMRANRYAIPPSRSGGRVNRTRRLEPLARAIVSGVRAAVDSGNDAQLQGKVAFTFAPIDRSHVLSGPVFADAVRVVWIRNLVLMSGRFRLLPAGGVECVVDAAINLVQRSTDAHNVLINKAGDLLQHACTLLGAMFDDYTGQFVVPEVLAAMSPDTFTPEDNHTVRAMAETAGLPGAAEIWDTAAFEALVSRDQRITVWNPESGASVPSKADLVVMAPMEMIMRRPLDPEWATHPTTGMPAPKRKPSRDGEVVVLCHGEEQVESEWVSSDGRWVPHCQPHRPVLMFPNASRLVYPGLWAIKANPHRVAIHPGVNSPGAFRNACYATWLDAVTAVMSEGGRRLDDICTDIANVGRALGIHMTEADTLLALVNPSHGFEVKGAMPICVVADHGDESLRWESGGLVVDLSLKLESGTRS